MPGQEAERVQRDRNGFNPKRACHRCCCTSIKMQQARSKPCCISSESISEIFWRVIPVAGATGRSLKCRRNRSGCGQLPMSQHHDSTDTEKLPISVWPVTQQTSQRQRAGRYLKECAEHPGKMVPDLARRIVEEFSRPGDLVLDPMAGIGTTLAEGALVGRHCIGVELESKWADLASRNLDHMLATDQREQADVRIGDARELRRVLGDSASHVDLIATSPPYSCDVSVSVYDSRTGRIERQEGGYNYSSNRSNLGHARGDKYVEEMGEVYRSCFDVLRPGGLMVTVTKNMHQKGKLVDVARRTAEAAEASGFVLVEHIIALLCGVRNDGLVARPSFWQQRHVKAARLAGVPQYLVAHEDVLVFRRPIG